MAPVDLTNDDKAFLAELCERRSDCNGLPLSGYVLWPR
jgi:hypothetical protein